MSLAFTKQSVRISLGHSLSLLTVLVAHKYHDFTFKLVTTASLKLCSNSALTILTPSNHLNPHKLAAKIMIIGNITTSKIIANCNHAMSTSIYINFRYEIWKIKSVQINITMIKISLRWRQ